MTIILVLIPLSIVLLTLAGAAFFWAVDNDQYDDMDTPGLMPLTADPAEASCAVSEPDLRARHLDQPS